ncbi:MAG: hypothetical protein LC733_11980 [Actinobacteria bacterium]|nr:hypothetical protein [Actinomycetota bacterium]
MILVLSASLTALLAAGLSVVTIDLMAYQCGADTNCSGKRWWLTPLKAGPIADYAGRRVALGIVVATLLVFALAYLSRRSRGQYEATTVPAFALDGPDRPVLARATTWRGNERVLRLGRFHRAAALGTVAAMGASVAADLADAAGKSVVPAAILAVVAALTVAATLVALALDLRKLARPLAVVATVTLLLTVVVAALLPAAGRPLTRLSIQRGPQLIFGVQLALLLVLGLVILVQSRAKTTGPPTPEAFRWATPLVLAALSVFMTGSVLAGITVRLADVLGEPVTLPGGATQAVEILYPVSFDWASLALAVTLLLLGIQAFVFRSKVSKVSAVDIEAIQAEYDLIAGEAAPRDDKRHRDWAAGVAKARRLTARLSDLDRFVSVTVITVLVLLAVSYPVFIRPRGGGLTDYPAIAGRWHWVQSASTWVVALLPLGGMWLLTNSWRGAGQRKSVGVVWDLATYWPRWFNSNESPW